LGRVLHSTIGRAACAWVLLLAAGGVARADPIRTGAAAAPTPADAASDAYAANAFVIIHVGKHTDAVDEKGSTWRPVRGLVYRFSLDPPAFLDAVGRSDLADHERKRHRTARTLSIVGDIVAAVGIITAVWGLGVRGGWVALSGLSAAIGGAVAHEIGESMLKPSLRESEALGLADGYNRALRLRLGLPPVESPLTPPPTNAARSPSFALAAVPLPSGAAAMLGTRF
jgi:hypothetical protein